MFPLEFPFQGLFLTDLVSNLLRTLFLPSSGLLRISSLTSERRKSEETEIHNLHNHTKWLFQKISAT